jgi:hypothetical protein
VSETPYQRPERLHHQLNNDDSEGVGALATALGGLALVVIITIAMVLYFAF